MSEKIARALILLCLSPAGALCQHNAELIDHPAATRLYMQAKQAVDDQYFLVANELLIEAILTDSLNADYYDLLAFSAAKSGHLELLLECYDQSSRLFPRDHRIFYHHGDAFQMLEQYDMAIEAYNKAIDLVQHEAYFTELNLYYFNRGNAFLKLRNYRRAIEDYSQSLTIKDWHVGSYVNRGIARYQSDNKPGACKDWEKAESYGHPEAKGYIDQYCK